MAQLSARRTAQRAARAALDKKAADLIVLDVQGVSSVTDYFLVCSAKSTTHVRTIIDAIRTELKTDGVRPLHAEGRPESGWVLLDYGDVLVHVFLEDTRAYYALERLWGDAPSVPIEG
jgi:ribosome-associated protein